MSVTNRDMWRLELLHPLVVHFPIALLIVATAFELTALVCSGERRNFLRTAALLLFVLGAGAAWCAVWAGEEAEDIVRRTLCDSNVVELHGDWGETSAWIFSAVASLSLLRFRLIESRVLSGLISMMSVAGAVSLGYAGHLGGTLVYQQGAAVVHPRSDCPAVLQELGNKPH